jgi:simple sugar transport system ATP-binding protein
MGGKDAGLSVRDLSVASRGRWSIRGLSFDVRPGGMHLVLGERDTGKTALLETIAGLRKPEDGTVSLEGEEAAAKTRRRRVAFLPRESPVRQLKVLERLLLHDTPRVLKLGVDWKRGREKARALAARVGLEALLDVPYEALRPVERKLIEVAAALRQRPLALLVDEPTTDLGPHEARHFLTTLGDILRAEGIPAVLTTVWPRDAYPLATAVTIVWRAAEPATVAAAETTEGSLVERWTGGLDIRRAPTGPHAAGDTLVRAEGLILHGRGRETSLAGIDFEARAGEVLAIVGAPSDGLDLLHDALLGNRVPERGSILFLGKEIAKAPRRVRVESGMTFVNPPIARDQSVNEFTVEENMILGQTHGPPFARAGFLRAESIRGNCLRALEDFELSGATPRTRLLDLGLDQRQRLIVAREVIHNPRLLVVRSPGQGLGLEAQEYVRRTLILQCERGSGLLWLTEEPEEALRVADRLAVLTAGRFVWLPVTETLTREAIIAEMSGAAA